MFDFEINIQNLVLTGSFSEGINLCVANSKLLGSKRNQSFPGLFYKLKNTPVTFLLFKSGKFVCTGTKTKTQGKKTLTHLLAIIKTKDLVSTHCTFKWGVKTLVASIELSGATTDYKQFTSEIDTLYTPDKFNTTIHKPDPDQAAFLFFLSGKIICSGATDKETLKQTLKKYYTQLVENKTLEKIWMENSQ